ncbi:MAG: MFS transporter [Caldilineaceae bacterium]|nr:MFS transporter [Caldilineaceae bacterium]
MNLRTMDRRLFTILMIVFVQMVGAAMIMPILPLYAKNEFAMSPREITWLGTAFFAAQFLAGPYLGRLSDRIGRMPVLIVSQIGTALSFALLAVAPSVAILFIARIVDGITGGNIIVAQAYITDITPREKRTEALGYIFAIFGVGFIVGPALGSILAAAFGPRMPYIMAAVAAGLVVLLTWLTLDETVTDEQQASNRTARKANFSAQQILSNAPLLFVLVIGFVAQFGFGLLQSTFSLYGEAVLFAGYSQQAALVGIGLLLASIGLGQVFTQTWLLRRLLKRFDEVSLVLLGIAARTIAMLTFAAITSPWLGMPASILFAVGMGITMPSLQSIATTTVDDSARGGVLGIFQSTTSLAIIFSTLVAGIIFDVAPTLPYWIGALLTLAAGAPAFFLSQQLRHGSRDTRRGGRPSVG